MFITREEINFVYWDYEAILWNQNEQCSGEKQLVI